MPSVTATRGRRPETANATAAGMRAIYLAFWCNATEILRRTISRDQTSLFCSHLAFRRSRILRRLGRAFPELLRLLVQRLHPLPDVVRLQSHHLLEVARLHQILGNRERARDIALGKCHGLFRDVPGTFSRGFGLTFERAHGLVRRGNEAVEGLPRLLDAFLGKGAHFGGKLETVRSEEHTSELQSLRHL